MVKKKTEQQESMWIVTTQLQVQPQITFYSKLNAVLDSFGFGDKVRKEFSVYYSPKRNVRPPIDPEVYIKMIMVGFFEGISSERGISSRCADSLSIRSFLGYSITESTPDHSTLSVIRNRIPISVFSRVFNIVLEKLKKQGLVKGKNLSIDSSVMEANAALGSLKNRMTEESYSDYVKKLASEAGIDSTDKEAVSRFDKKRKDRKTSNKEWYNPYDKDAKIGRTKHGSTDMIYKPENIVDIDTGAIIDADVLYGDTFDADGQSDRIANAQIRMYDISDTPEELEPIETLTNDKGYYTVEEITAVQAQDIQTVIPDKEINRKTEKLTDDEALAVERAKLIVKSKTGKSLLRRRGMYVERSFAHILDSGASRRTHLKGIEKNQKRYLIATATYNLSLLMRTIFGVGTPKQLVASFILVLKWFIDVISNFKNMIIEVRNHYLTNNIKYLHFDLISD
jgi:transposase